MTIQEMIDYLTEGVASGSINPSEVMLAWYWNKYDAEQIIGQKLTDNEWNYVAGWIERKSDWLYDDVHSEIESKYKLMNEIMEERAERAKRIEAQKTD
jgi:hypothetical protein